MGHVGQTRETALPDILECLLGDCICSDVDLFSYFLVVISEMFLNTLLILCVKWE